MVRVILDSREREIVNTFLHCSQGRVLVFLSSNSVEEAPCSPPVTVSVGTVNFGVDRTIIVSQSVDPDKITRLTSKVSKYLIGEEKYLKLLNKLTQTIQK